MNVNNNLNFRNESNQKGKNIDFLKLLENKCDGLENMLCKNYIDTISKKLKFIENNISYELDSKIINEPQEQNQEIIEDNIQKLNNNFNFIERNYYDHLNSPDTNSSEIIRNKLEENYMLLEELEKNNRPIFSKSHVNDNSIFVENKIKAMDNKLSTLFRSDNAKLYSERNIKNNSNPDKFKIIDENDINTIRKNEREEKLKELYEKLNETERKIKNIAGNLLHNL